MPDFDRHVMEQTYGDPALYGAPPGPFPEELFLKVGKVVLLIAAGDGTLSSKERAYAVGLAKALGGSPRAIEQQRTWDPKGHRIEEFLDPSIRPMAKVMLYDAIRIARADGFSDKERELARKGAKLLGLDPVIVPQIEALLAVEDGVRAARISVMTPPEKWTGVPGPDATMLENDWWRFEQMGSFGIMPFEVAMDVGKSILIICSADQELTETEIGWFFGMGKAFGVPDAMVEQVMKFDPRSARLEEHLTPAVRPYARIILYDAIRCASSDGFADRERAMARKAAKLLGLDTGIVPWAEAVIQLENDTRQARIKLLSPA